MTLSEERGPTETLLGRKAGTNSGTAIARLQAMEVQENSTGYPLRSRMQWVMRPKGSLREMQERMAAYQH